MLHVVLNQLAGCDYIWCNNDRHYQFIFFVFAECLVTRWNLVATLYFNAEPGEHSKIKSNKGWKIPQDGICRMKYLLPLAFSNHSTSCFETFRKKCTKGSQWFCLELSVTPSGSCDEVMNSIYREHVVCFKIPDNGHYYIGLTVHLFEDFIWDCQVDVYDWYTLFSRSLHQPFKPFWTLSPPDIIYECNEEFDSFHNDQPDKNPSDRYGMSHVFMML